MTASLQAHAIEGLTAALKSVKGNQVCDQTGYAHSLADNLIDGLDLDDARADFEAGAGNELHTKMRAAYSSSALAVNCFGRWAKEPSSLRLGDQTGFDKLQFEAKAPTGLRGGTPPHLDLILTRPKAVLAIESKCTEYLVDHRARFSDAYREQIRDYRTQTGWFAEMEDLRRNPTKYRLLDAAQLIKHYFGLARTYANRSVTLLYLFWEPVNASDFSEFAEHRDEFDRFAAAVEGSSVDFSAQSYPDLWASWDPVDRPSWLSDHLKRLRRRYEVVI